MEEEQRLAQALVLGKHHSSFVRTADTRDTEMGIAAAVAGIAVAAADTHSWEGAGSSCSQSWLRRVFGMKVGQQGLPELSMNSFSNDCDEDDSVWKQSQFFLLSVHFPRSFFVCRAT